MKKLLPILITLAVIALIPAILWGTTMLLNPIAEVRAEEEHAWLMETLLPGGKDFKKVAYDGEDDTIRSIHQSDAGYVIETSTRGYADDITVIIGLDNEGKVIGLVAYDAHETPGLGNGILTDHVFLSQFLNKSGTFTVGAVKNEGEEENGADAVSSATDSTASAGEEIAIDAISGATVSSKALARCVNAAIAYVTGADVDSSATEW